MWLPSKVALGWIRITHVCASWRAIIIGHTHFWADWVLTFYSVDVVNTFLHRARDQLLVLDFDLLGHHCDLRALKSSVTELIMQKDIWHRARAVNCTSKHAGYRGYLPDLTRSLSNTTFVHLRKVVLFLPKEQGQLLGFRSPRVTELSLSSNARVTEEARLSVFELDRIIEECTMLSSLCLHRVVNTQLALVPTCVPNGFKSHAFIRHLSIQTFDECMLHPILQTFARQEESEMCIEIFGPRDLARAVSFASTIYGRGHDTYYKVDLRDQSDSACGSDGAYMYYSECCEVTVMDEQEPGLRLVLRLDDETPAWTWFNFMKTFSVDRLSHLIMSPDRLSRPLPMDKLIGLRTIEINCPADLRRLRELPDFRSVECVIIEIVYSADLHALAKLWRWLQIRFNMFGTAQPSIPKVILKGPISRDMSMAQYRRHEAPTISAVRAVCDLEDHRIYKGVAYGEHTTKEDLDGAKVFRQITVGGDAAYEVFGSDFEDDGITNDIAGETEDEDEDESGGEDEDENEAEAEAETEAE